MPDIPIAYFITFHTYGTRLHGCDSGSVDCRHHEVGMPFLGADPIRLAIAQEKMTAPAYYLDEDRAVIVRDGIVEECQFRGWLLHALHIRTNHVHLVVSATHKPERVMQMCKSHASRCLNRTKYESPQHKRWSAHGSTVYVWDESELVTVIDYTLHRQGETMMVYSRSEQEDAPF